MLTIDIASKELDVTVKTKDGTPLSVASAEIYEDVIEVTLDSTHQNIADGYNIGEALKNNPNECALNVATKTLSEEA